MALTLTTDERTELERRVRSLKIRSEDARRARVILMLANGDSYSTIEATVPCFRDYINRWRRRFLADREYESPFASIRITRARRASSDRILRLRTRRSSSVRSSVVNVSAIWRQRVPVLLHAIQATSEPAAPGPSSSAARRSASRARRSSSGPDRAPSAHRLLKSCG